MQLYCSHGGRLLLIAYDLKFSCQQSGHCCCDPTIIVTLTYRDLYRLYTILESNFNRLLQKISFYTLDVASTSNIQKQLVLEPIQTVEGSVIPGLRKNEEGPCVFYHHPDCLIYPNRPLACKNYPIAFLKEDSNISAVWAKNSPQSCPGIGKGPKIHSKKLKKLGKYVLEEIKNHNNVIKDFNIEAAQGNPLNAREALWILVIYGEKKK